MTYTAKQYREKAAVCRKLAAGKTGEPYHREMQKARAYEAQARERDESLWCDSKEQVA